MGQRIYIDFGANVGDSVATYVREHSPDVAFAFEPNPKLAEGLRARFHDYSTTVRVCEAAAWILDGVVRLYLAHDVSSTLLTGKVAYKSHPEFAVDYEKWATVRSIDIGRWMLEHFHAKDDIVIKMDIEGSEYKVLQRMIDTEALSLVREIRCEWHQDRFPQVTRDEHERIRKIVAERTTLINWR